MSIRCKSARRPMRRSRHPAHRRNSRRRARREGAQCSRCRSRNPLLLAAGAAAGISSGRTDRRPSHRRRRPRRRTSPSSYCLSPIFPATQPKTISPTALPRISRLTSLASAAPSSSRNTAFAFKGKNVDARDIGKDFGVRYVLEGSVQRDQNQVRVNAQLIDAKSGGHIWAERFDKPLANIFSMQDDIVASLASRSGAELMANEARRAERTRNPDSMDLYFSRHGVVQQGAKSRRYCPRAISLSVRWRLIQTTSTQSSEGRVLMLRRLQAITWTRRPNASRQLRRT